MANKQPTEKKAPAKPAIQTPSKKAPAKAPAKKVAAVAPTKPAVQKIVSKPAITEDQVTRQEQAMDNDPTPADQRFDIKTMEENLRKDAIANGKTVKPEVKVTSTAKPVINQTANTAVPAGAIKTEQKTASNAMRDEEALKTLAMAIEDILTKHTAGLPMSRIDAEAYIKKSNRQYMVSITDAPNQPGYCIINLTFGQHKVSTNPIQLHA
jgi:hypothetical protein